MSTSSRASTLTPEGNFDNMDPAAVCDPSQERATAFDPTQATLMAGPPQGFATAAGVIYPVGQLRVMAEVLLQARLNREFPITTASDMDYDVIVQDYEDLTRLRQIRGNLRFAASRAYNEEFERIGRQIRQRDRALSDDIHFQESARRVATYMESVNQERRHYEAARLALEEKAQSPAPTVEDLNQQIRDILEQTAEHTIEHAMADASAPLRFNVGRLGNENARLAQQNTCFAQQNTCFAQQNTCFAQQNTRLAEQAAIIGRQVQQQYQSAMAVHGLLEPQVRNLMATSHNVLSTSELVVRLADIVDNLPNCINSAINDSIKYYVEETIKVLIGNQQRAFTAPNVASAPAAASNVAPVAPVAASNVDVAGNVAAPAVNPSGACPVINMALRPAANVSPHSAAARHATGTQFHHTTRTAENMRARRAVSTKGKLRSMINKFIGPQ